MSNELIGRNTNDLLADCPDITLYSVGECEMLERANGAWMTRANVRQLLEWVMDNDDRDVMFEKLLYLNVSVL